MTEVFARPTALRTIRRYTNCGHRLHQFGVRKPCWDTIQRYTKDLFLFLSGLKLSNYDSTRKNCSVADFVSTWRIGSPLRFKKSAISAIFAYSRLPHSIFLGATPIRGLQQSAQHPADQAGPNVVAPHQGLDDTEDQHTNLRINGTWWVWVKFLGTHGPTFFSRCCVFNPLPQTIVT